MFRTKPPYSTEEIQTQVSVLERLHKLRDMCDQKFIVTADEKWAVEADRYSRNIETGQRYLTHMLEKNSK